MEKGKKEEQEKEEKVEKKSHFFIKFLMLIIVIICSLYFYTKYVGVKGLVVKEYRINSEILSENFDGIKIVHFSDILYNSTFDLNDFKELVSNINKLKPDIIVYTGDLIYSKKISNSDKEKIIESFSRGSAVDYEFGKWKFEKGVFVQKELLSHPPRECE